MVSMAKANICLHLFKPKSHYQIKLCYFHEQPESMQIFAKPKHLMRHSTTYGI